MRTTTAPSTATAEWALWSTCARLVVTDPAALPAARAIADDYLKRVDDVANRFREDSEIRTLVRDDDGFVTLSVVLADLVEEALAAAEITDGDVDLTVGSALRRLGYDRDLSLVTDTSPLRAVIRPVPGWRSLSLRGSRMRLPEGVELDLGAIAKAVAADRVAALVHDALDVGVLVSLGGDIATAGPAQYHGWQIHVQDRADDPATQVSLPAGTAIATSSSTARQWRRGDRVLHHIVDPRTGQPAELVWRSVTVAATTCSYANAITTASLVRGIAAPAWVDGLGLSGRFVAADRTVELVGGWPREAAA
jgi:thiamine biosynthesis lipoprotein